MGPGLRRVMSYQRLIGVGVPARCRRAAVGLLLVAAACGRAADRDGSVTIRFWGMGREGEVVAELVRDFERENPAIRVRVQQIPWTAAHEKLLTAYVGGAEPDVAQLGNTWIPEFAAINALEPLDGWLAASGAIGPEDYFGGIWQTNLVAGKVWGVPWYVDTRVVFYRRDILAAAGFDSIPGSWTGWREAMGRIKEEVGPGRYAIFLPTNEWAQPAIFGLQAGSPLLADDGRYGAFGDPAFLSGFDFYVNLFRDGLAPPAGDRDIANAYQEFARGYFAMWITGPWNLGEFRRRLPPEMQDRWATAPLPGPAGGESGVSLAGGASLVMFRGSRHQDAAWKLIEFLSRPEQQLRFYELTGSLPARTAAWEASGLRDDEHARAFWLQLQRVVPLPAVPEIESILARLIDHSEAVIRGGTPAEQALAALDRDVDRILEKRRWVLARQQERGDPGDGDARGGGAEP